jgi:transposase
MAREIVTEELRAQIAPLLPPPKKRRFRHPGRKPIDDRKALTGIVFVLKTGIPWEYLPQEMGCGCGMTAWRRLHYWHHKGVWQRMHEKMLAKLNGADRLDRSRALVDSGSVRAVGGGGKNRPQSHRSAQTGLEAQCHRRGPRSAAGDNAHRREQARCHAAPAAG